MLFFVDSIMFTVCIVITDIATTSDSNTSFLTKLDDIPENAAIDGKYSITTDCQWNWFQQNLG